MKKLLALLLALTLCATAALAENGVFDYTAFEENEDINFEIDRFDDEWSIIVAMSIRANMRAWLDVQGTRLTAMIATRSRCCSTTPCTRSIRGSREKRWTLAHASSSLRREQSPSSRRWLPPRPSIYA